MDELRRRILTEGRNLGGGILKVDGFLNHQLDPELTEAMGGAFRDAFDARGVTAVSKVVTAEVSGIANATLFPRTDSWWTGANVEGKPRYFSAYLGGSIYYQRIADLAKDYAGFDFEPAHHAEDAEAS